MCQLCSLSPRQTEMVQHSLPLPPSFLPRGLQVLWVAIAKWGLGVQTPGTLVHLIHDYFCFFLFLPACL